MSVTNLAVGQQINLATVLNTKLEKPILQSEMGLDAQATVTKMAVRWDEFSLKFNNNGTFKGIIQADMLLDVMATLTKQAIRWDEFSLKHNNDGSFKVGIIANADISSTAAITSNKLSIQLNYKKSSVASPSATINTPGTTVTLLPATNYVSMFPQGIDVVFGGTFGSETVTATVKAIYSDASYATVTKTATVVGTSSFTNSDLMSLIKDGLYIKEIDVYSQSSIASSSATCTFTHCGFYL